ncbi:putative 20S cyclosome subunit [Rosellinia necatrix]|uniref:Putative 20S cyclosome subunit n=1 Tax=Rosellinia necatrix TaxID=77044 RepID=A0A1W2TXB5_ROSNE|nr:putative 20S cyclosome subunit [Rosellinia necatrix]
MSLSRPQILELENELRKAVIACSQRCLYHAAKWAAELLNSLPEDEDDIMFDGREHSGILAPQRHLSELQLEYAETSKYSMAKALFDCHEFQRCADTLLAANHPDRPIMPIKKLPPPPRHKGISQRGLFLACYALLVLGEKEKAEKAPEILDPPNTGLGTNNQLSRIKAILEKRLIKEINHRDHGPSEGWYGMAQAKEQNDDAAKIWLLKSVSINPWNWGAWQELRSIIRDARDLESIHSQLEPSIMAYIFSIYCRQELHQTSAALLSDISQLQSVFPRSSFLKGQKALVFYHLISASSIFSELLVTNPMYLEFLSYYSSVLYTLKLRGRLSFVAQCASSVEPYRPETCCVIGNYYSLLSRYEDAIVYFRRALALDRNYAPAWTLLGHEYLNGDNHNAAVSCYLRAVGLNRQDYRAFAGLGQVYALVGKPNLAFDFHRRALAFRPEEIGIWRAMADCLVSQSKLPQAISWLEKAVEYSDNVLRDAEGHSVSISRLRRGRVELLFQLAALYEEYNDRREATAHLEQGLDEAINCGADAGAENGPAEGMRIISEARLLLAQWALDAGDHSRARHFASMVERPGECVEQARRLLAACSLDDMESDP